MAQEANAWGNAQDTQMACPLGYIIAGQLAPTMGANDVQQTLECALEKSGLEQARVRHRPRLLSDNGPAYLSKDLRKFLKQKDIRHIRGARITR